MTPLEIEILLHFHCTPVQYRMEANPAPVWEGTINAFMEAGLVEPNPIAPSRNPSFIQSAYRITEKGRAYVDLGLCQVPLPEREWRIPQRDETDRSMK